jgi:hypothetical protein
LWLIEFRHLIGTMLDNAPIDRWLIVVPVDCLHWVSKCSHSHLRGGSHRHDGMMLRRARILVFIEDYDRIRRCMLLRDRGRVLEEIRHEISKATKRDGALVISKIMLERRRQSQSRGIRHQHVQTERING